MTTPRRILVTGATGNVSGALIDRLATDPSVELVAALRSPEKSDELPIPAIHFDYDRPETFQPALAGIDSLFMMTGYTVDMLNQSKMLVDAARKAGVSHIVHLGSPGNDDTRVAHYAWQQLVERYIEWSGIPYTHLRPQIYMQNLLGYGNTGIVRDGVIRQYVGGAQLSWVDCADVGSVAAASLAAPEKHIGKTHRLGYELRGYAEIAEIFTEVIGQPFRYEPHDAEEFLEKSLAAGAEPVYMRSVYENYRDLAAGIGPGVTEVFDNFTELTGREPRLIADFIRAHADQFRY